MLFGFRRSVWSVCGMLMRSLKIYLSALHVCVCRSHIMTIIAQWVVGILYFTKTCGLIPVLVKKQTTVIDAA
jgi:hypothetical protein